MKKFLVYSAIFFLLALLFFSLIPVPKKWLDRVEEPSVRILDRNGVVLRDRPSVIGGRRQFVSLDEISPHLIDITLFVEDRRFYFHPGIDPMAVARALIFNIRERRVVSGGSTITQQLARIISQVTLSPTLSPRGRGKGEGGRTLVQKMKEVFLALWLEGNFSKKEILTMYLNNAPYGNELYGAEAASQRYFRKSARDLTLSEAAFLTGLVRAPSLYNPYLYYERAESRCRIILERYGKAEAGNQTVHLFPRREKFLAPHFVDYVLNTMEEESSDIKTTLDLSLQTAIENLITQELDGLKKKGVGNAAVLVLDTKTGEILAMIGSKNYRDDSIGGYVNGVFSRRQPGSALKPFAYALALDNGASPADLLPDIPSRFETLKGDYAPDNYDRRFHGPVRVRDALGSSLNIPALHLMQKVGVDRFYHLLKKTGFEGLTREPSYYGLGLVLGNAEVNLMELTRAYSIFGRDGTFLPVRFQNFPLPRGERVRERVTSRLLEPIFSPEALFLIRDILSDDKARSLAFGEGGPLDFDFPVVVKTGTSTNYRDNWTVGSTPEVTVGVWVGNFDGSPMHEVSGVTGAAPLFHKILLLALKGEEPNWPEAPSTLVQREVCPLSGHRRGENCPGGVLEYFREEQPLTEECPFHRQADIDIRNNLLATADCAPRFVATKTYVDYPVVYQEWADQQNLSLLPGRFSPLCAGFVLPSPLMGEGQGEGGPERLVLLNPADGSTYKMDPLIPDEYETITFRAGGGISSEIKWELDGKLLAEGTSSLRWPLQRGEHQLIFASDPQEIHRIFTVK